MTITSLLTKRSLGIGALIVAAALIRIGQFIPNVAPISAIALLGGATLSPVAAFIVPTVAMLAADSVIGFDYWPITAAVYLSFALTVGLGMTLRGRWNPWRLAGVSILSSILFYLITNAAVWRFSGMYPPTLDGLWLSYWLALPFFRNTLFGDMAYTFTLFLAVQYVPVVFRALKRYRTPEPVPQIEKETN
jgi:hypothetical protein